MPARSPEFAALAAFGIVAHVAWISSWMTESIRAAGYDWAQEQISALAAEGASTATIMVPAFVVLGLGTIAQGLAVRSSATSKVAPTLVIVAGVSAVAAGLFRCDPGCPALPHGSWHSVVHNFALIGYSVPLVVAACVDAHLCWRDAPGFGRFSLACASVAGPTFLYAEIAGHDNGVGVVQRLSVATLSTWSIVVAARFLLARRTMLHT